MSAKKVTPLNLDKTIPIIYAKTIIDLVLERGKDISYALKSLDIKEKDLAIASQKISIQQWLSLIAMAVSITTDENIGLEVGLRQPITSHGHVGLAMICSATLGEALSILHEFWQLRDQSSHLTFHEEDGFAVFEFMPNIPMSKEVERVLLDGVICLFHNGIKFVFGNQDLGQEIWFNYEIFSAFERMQPHLPVCQFNKKTMQYRIPKHLLNYRLPTANSENLKRELELCQQEILLLKRTELSTANQVRALMLFDTKNGYPTAAQLASKLNLSERTFRRHLENEGTSYKLIREEVCCRDAIHLIETTSLGIQAIAGLVGYASPSNFTRAFKIWSGKTPLEYRNKMK